MPRADTQAFTVRPCLNPDGSISHVAEAVGRGDGFRPLTPEEAGWKPRPTCDEVFLGVVGRVRSHAARHAVVDALLAVTRDGTPEETARAGRLIREITESL